MPKLHTILKPFKTRHLKLTDLHEIYYEVSGNPDGLPVVFIHGGPGGGSKPDYRGYFNPEKFKIILFDQRGCGKSLPFSELKENTTWDLVEDIEKLKSHLSIQKWAIFGGSWGSTLALAYAQTYPDSCEHLFLRGIFLLRKKEIQWFYQYGASRIYPDAFADYLKPIPENERDDLVRAYYKRLTGENEKVRKEAAKAWATWEGRTSKLTPDPKADQTFGEEKFADAFARIECHYFANNGFFKTDAHLLENIDKMRAIPGLIVHGRYDVVCPVENAWELHEAWPESSLQIIEAAGHSLAEPGITEALIKATDDYARLKEK
jgi:proline iminopeptidase